MDSYWRLRAVITIAILAIAYLVSLGNGVIHAFGNATRALLGL